MKTSLMLASVCLASILFSSVVLAPFAFADEEKDFEMIDKKGKKMEMKMKIKDTIELDRNFDGLVDFNYKIKFNSKKTPNYELSIFVADGCVGGSTFDDAKMKIGFSNQAPTSPDIVWMTEGFDVWTDKKSAKKLKQNKTIDLIDLPDGVNLKLFPLTGDDIISPAEKVKKSVFKHKDHMSKLDKQSGWKGKIFFDIPEGDYIIWTAQPAFDIDPTGVFCGGITGIGIHLPLTVD